MAVHDGCLVCQCRRTPCATGHHGRQAHGTPIDRPGSSEAHRARSVSARASTALDREALRAGVIVDVSVRLKAPLGDPGSPQRLALSALRRVLRSEVDGLLDALASRMVTVVCR